MTKSGDTNKQKGCFVHPFLLFLCCNHFIALCFFRGCSGPHCTNKASMPLQVKILPQIAQIFTEIFRGQNYRIAKNVHPPATAYCFLKVGNAPLSS